MPSTGVDPTGSVRVTVGGAATDLEVVVSAGWRERTGLLGAAVVAAWLRARPPGFSSPMDGDAGEDPGDAAEDLRGVPGETLCAVVLDVAGRLSAAATPRTLVHGERITVTVTAGAVSGVDLDPHWLSGATADEIGRQVGAALRSAVTATDRAERAVLAEATRLGADPVGLMRAFAVA